MPVDTTDEQDMAAGKGKLCPLPLPPSSLVRIPVKESQTGTRKKKTAIPVDFKPDDSDYEYCQRKWGAEKLADVFLSNFIEVFQDNGRTHIDWHKTYKNFIRRASPSGEFYRIDYWERMLQNAKGNERKRIHRYDPRGRAEPPAERSSAVLAHSVLATLRQGMK